MEKNKRKKYIILKIVAIISVIAYLVFSIMLMVLDMLPLKYLSIFLGAFSVLYIIFLIFVFVKKIKRKFKIVSFVFLTIFGISFGIGTKYLSETINFIDVINNKLLQKEPYYIMTLEPSIIEEISDLVNKKVGIYNSVNSESALEKIEKKVNVDYHEYRDIIEMFEDLEEEKISAVLINDSIKSLLESDLASMNLNLKEIYKLSISIEKKDIVKVVDVTKKTFNIYVAGGDSYGNIENVTNTDVNMVITINPNKRQILLTSIPRDYYVNLPSFGNDAYDKLTHAGYYGIEESVKSIEKLLDIDINYYVKVNFSTVVGVIDAIGGVDVNSDYSFCVTTTGVCVKKGINHLDGYSAMMFARERESFVDGDVQRVKNQQKVIEAVINKVTSSTMIITNFSKILDSVSESLSTNMDTKSINRFVKMQLNDMRGWGVDNTNLVGTDLYTTETYTFPGTNLYVMQQSKESIQAAKTKIKEYMN